MRVIGAFGAGIDYFLTPDVSFCLETKYIVSRGTRRRSTTSELDGNRDTPIVPIGVRTYLLSV